MMTIQRMYEVIEACKSLIASPNVTEKGKRDCHKIMEEVYRELLMRR